MRCFFKTLVLIVVVLAGILAFYLWALTFMAGLGFLHPLGV